MVFPDETILLAKPGKWTGAKRVTDAEHVATKETWHETGSTCAFTGASTEDTPGLAFMTHSIRKDALPADSAGPNRRPKR